MGVEGCGWGGLGGLTVTSTVTPIDPVSALRLCCGSVAQELQRDELYSDSDNNILHT